MNKSEVKMEGTDKNIYSGAYLVARGYEKAFEVFGDIEVEIHRGHLSSCKKRIYFKQFDQDQTTIYWHHTSDIHAVVEEQLVDTETRKAGYFYISMDNIDYYPHPRTDKRYHRRSGYEIERELNPGAPYRKVIGIVGHRPKGMDPEPYDITNNKHYGLARRFFEAAFEKAKKNHPTEELAVLTTGYIGYAQLAEKIAIEKGISVWLHVPFKGFQNKWKEREKKLFEELADKISVSDLSYGETPKNENDRRLAYKKASRYIVDHCDQLISIYDGKSGDEVADAIFYANEKRRHVTNFYPNKEGFIQSIKDNYKFEGEHPYERFITEVVGPNR